MDMKDFYQGYGSFEEMMADRPSGPSHARSIFDVKNDVEASLHSLGFKRTAYTPIYAEYKNSDGISVRVHSRGFTYAIYLADGRFHSNGDLDSLSAKLKRKTALQKT